MNNKETMIYNSLERDINPFYCGEGVYKYGGINMAKRILKVVTLIVAAFLFCSAFAENDFFTTTEIILKEITDCSDKEFLQLSASNCDPTSCALFLNFAGEDYSIVAVDDQKALLVYPFEKGELANCIVELLLRFDDIEEQLPNGKFLQYDLKLSEESTYHITKDNVITILRALIGAAGSTGEASQPSYDSTIPFENLEFTDFIYEGYSSGNASISGMVKNHNSFAVDGYFYILFYKDDKLVHTELSALPTIPAGGTGVWSDLIYGLEYDRVEYADSNVIRK